MKRWAAVFVGLHALLLVALLTGMVLLWRIRCESFGCMGVGVAWFGWAVCFVIVLGVGWLARVGSRGTRLAAAGAVTWRVQCLSGAALLLLWAVTQLG